MLKRGEKYVVLGVLHYYIGEVKDYLPPTSSTPGEVGLINAHLILDAGRSMGAILCGDLPPDVEILKFPKHKRVFIPLGTITAYFEWGGVDLALIKAQIPAPESDLGDPVEAAKPPVH